MGVHVRGDAQCLGAMPSISPLERLRGLGIDCILLYEMYFSTLEVCEFCDIFMHKNDVQSASRRIHLQLRFIEYM